MVQGMVLYFPAVGLDVIIKRELILPRMHGFIGASVAFDFHKGFES